MESADWTLDRRLKAPRIKPLLELLWSAGAARLLLEKRVVVVNIGNAIAS
jgi:hypothetical protein